MKNVFCKAWLLAAVVWPLAALAEKPDDIGIKTVIGARNAYLHDGAQELMSGEIEEGIRLTRIGLQRAMNSRERQAGYSNLCVGYLRLEQLDVALDYCNRALEINERHWRALVNRSMIHVMEERFEEADRDLSLAEEIAPNARTVKVARSVYRDATDPVVPTIVIDDRRADDAT